MATHWALDVQQNLRDRGVTIGVIQILKVWPLSDKINRSLQGVAGAYVLEDHSVLGGLGSLLSFTGFKGAIEYLGWPLGWTGHSGSDDALRNAAGLGTAQIADRIMRTLKEAVLIGDTASVRL
jgi:transketolase C-terminal domain/subunit